MICTTRVYVLVLLLDDIDIENNFLMLLPIHQQLRLMDNFWVLTLIISALPLGVPRINHHAPRIYPPSETSYTMRRRVNNIVTEKETVKHKKQGTTS